MILLLLLALCWTEQAVGVRVKRWITMHGLSVNVRPDLEHFEHIVPCGIGDRPVGSCAATYCTAFTPFCFFACFHAVRMDYSTTHNGVQNTLP